MKLEFFGAAAEVTGSCHILHIGGRQVLLDCGLIQGSRRDEERNRDPFPFDASGIDAVVLSHAHLDHCGRLPLLVKRGFKGPIYTQDASCELVAILLADAAHLAERDAEYKSRKTGKKVKPLYTVAEGERVIRQLQNRKYREIFEVVDGMKVRFRDAGHILGSASVEVWLSENGAERKIVFSGDLGQYDTPILRDPEPIDRADFVLMESTYGGRRHRDRAETVKELGEILTSERSRKGNILVPAFSIGRSQEIMYQLGKHFDEWDLGRFQIYLDSPMAIEASKVYWSNTHLYDEEATRLRSENGGMPLLPNLKLSRHPEESMAINRIRSGAIVIAGSGMCNGGRIIHHLKYNLAREETQVLITGYQANGSLGRRLVNREQSVRIHGRTIPVRATVHTVGGLSAHGDQDDLARWYECMENRPPVYLVHGEVDSQEDFRNYLGKRNGAEIHLPKPGDFLEL
ncbi:MAG: MBL fold metallo-hydrolase [Xanthomonadales bacterium]|nr:MBL fold metallo-hydrolase [Gammaproteobacteria bacterium]MBT8054316.1 MBL fold metallo-hydrolase [Gammaproteobacteria bacterium]NND57491.1 MBL fold metallo-hydrolase [Xanthomonadales bacterium]NNK51215.1 MBL fold metallo-hydrolase [Xanthomonadales bacterium]